MCVNLYGAQTLSNLSKRMMRMSWYSVSLSRMMSGSVTAADSSLLLLDWGKLDCLEEGEIKWGYDITQAKINDELRCKTLTGEEGMTGASSGWRVLTHLRGEGNRLLWLHPSVSEKRRHFFSKE